jgi:hypothetical protein
VQARPRAVLCARINVSVLRSHLSRFQRREAIHRLFKLCIYLLQPFALPPGFVFGFLPQTLLVLQLLEVLQLLRLWR